MALSPQECEAFWKVADKNKDDNLTIQELKAGLKVYCKEKRIILTDAQIAAMFVDIDKNNDCLISKQEFLDEMSKTDRVGALKKLFNDYDKDGDGNLTHDEIRQVLVASKMFKYPDEEMKRIIKQADRNMDGKISQSEFLAACTK